MKKFILKKLGDINKFSIPQMTSNADGKTSGSGTMGILICTAGTFTFLLGAIDTAFISKSTDIMMQSIIFVGIGVALLGYRKSKPTPLTEVTVDDTPVDTKEDIAINS
jgi:hypothetical protein